MLRIREFTGAGARVNALARECLQEARILAPARPGRHDEVEKEPPAERALELEAGRRARFAQEPPALAEDDALVAVAVDDDRRLDHREIPRLVTLPLLHENAEAVRNLLPRPFEELLADELGGARSGIGGRDRRAVEEILALGEVASQGGDERVEPLECERGHRDDLLEDPGLAERRHPWKESGLRDAVDLVQDGDPRRRRAREEIQREAVSAAGRHGDVDDQDPDVLLAERLECLAHHGLVQAVERLVEARGVHEHDLALGVRPHAEEPPPGRLRLVRDDRDLRPDEGVHQRGLPGIRTPDDGHRSGSPEPRAHASAFFPCFAGSSYRTRTRWIRRRSASSTRKRRPASWAVSPAFGMRPRRSETRPATVPYSSEGNVTPKRLAISGTLTRPATEYEPSSCATIGGCSTSCSSAISPTSSSTRSSSVARPVTAPYSSTTMASGCRRR